jgi:hypothetical protein
MIEAAILTSTNQQANPWDSYKLYLLRTILSNNIFQRLHQFWNQLFESYTRLAYPQQSKLVVNFLKGNEYDGI